MKQTDPQLKIRLPAEIKDWLERHAALNNRSMNAQIVHWLEGLYAEQKSLENAGFKNYEINLSDEESEFLFKYNTLLRLIGDQLYSRVRDAMEKSDNSDKT